MTKLSKIIVLHSIRGGVGKTLISLNLALTYAKLGRSICLIDLDFRAPNLIHLLNFQPPKLWMNDFLNNTGALKNILINITSRYHTKGKILIGFADPDIAAIRDIAQKDQRWEINALKKLYGIKEELASEHIEYVILDTSPGLLYSSVNAVACSDVVVYVSSADSIEINNMQNVIHKLYKAFEKPVYILMNKVISKYKWNDKLRKDIVKRVSSLINVPILNMIPCYCDLLNSSDMPIYVLKKPQHPFSKTIFNIAQQLSKNISVDTSQFGS